MLELLLVWSLQGAELAPLNQRRTLKKVGPSHQLCKVARSQTLIGGSSAALLSRLGHPVGDAEFF
jgi:hypothetical protein